MALFLGSGLLAAHPAASQASPVLLCFDRDLRVGVDDSDACLADRPPDYDQGDSIVISIEPEEAPLGATVYISVRCSSGCPSADPSASKVYWAPYRGSPVTFPADFIDPGPNNNGGNALLDKAPRYNATWTATYHIATPIEREFNTWLYNAYKDEHRAVRPGAMHHIKAFGFDPGADVTYRWERRDPNTGRYTAFATGSGRAGTAGPTTSIFHADFQFPKSEAQRIAACGGALYDCYRLVMSGAGKESETVNVQVGLAYVRRANDTTPAQDPGEYPSYKRTSNVTTEIDLAYPSGHLRVGPKFVPDDAPISARFGGHALRVAVERFYPFNDTAYLLADAPLRYDAGTLLWRVQWTVPKDLPMPNDGSRYRLRLVEARDVYGNIVANESLLNFTIEAAEILPTFAQSYRELRRTEEGIFRVAVLYHNGEPVTQGDIDNATPIRGCFVRVPPPAPPPAPPASPEVATCSSRPNVEIVEGTYYEGAWNFSKTYPRGYENVNEKHRFILVNGSRDRWGNQIWHAYTDPYLVVPATFDVSVSTVSRGTEVEVIERGNLVFVSATITYHDGSPYNHQVRVNPNSSEARVLQGTLVRRGPGTASDPYGPIASEEPFNLSESDSSLGRWSAFLQLTDDDTFTPVGIWTWKFDIEDNYTVPNHNVSTFDREVVSTVVQLCPTFHPSGSVPTGATVKFRFRLFYSECDVGREVPASVIQNGLAARVFRFNPQNLSTFGAPVSNTIIPIFSSATQDWTIEYQVPNQLFAGSYVFVLTGIDTYGNRLQPNARSRHFSTFTDIIEREIITQPPSEVLRGDSATVVFDAREGDTGVDPDRPEPRIQLERFDTTGKDCPRAEEEGGCWAREVADVRVPDPTLADHVGVFPVSVDTPVGLYRFSLQGRDRDFHIITAVSSTFGVSATQVARALLTPPPERTVKGEPFHFYVENVPGDVVNERVMFLDGRPLRMPAPQLQVEPGGRLNVTWAVPFEAPTGNYTLRLSGRDVNGNVITVITPPIEALPAALEGRIVGQPTRTLERGSVARLQFGVGYPDGSFYASQDTPRVTVVSATGVTFPAGILREGLSFAAVWEPAPDAPMGEYYFEVSPQGIGGTGNLFPPLRSNTFRIVPGTVTRGPIDEMPGEVERLNAGAFTVPFAPDDKYVAFELIYYGPSLSTAIDTQREPTEITRTPLTHTIDTANGKYVTRVVTDHQTQIGTFRIVMTGEDAHGNVISAASRLFIIRPTTISILFDTLPDDEAFGEGKTISFSFLARYTVGTVMDDSYGRPSATVLWDGRPVTQRPDLEYAAGKWHLSWTAPDILPAGEYSFIVGGSDVMGNPIATARTTPYVVSDPSLIESANKAVPGPSPALLALAIVGAAALFLRRRA